MAYMQPITDEFKKKVPATLKAIQTYPSHKNPQEAKTFGFKLDKATAIQMATQILMTCQTSEEIKIYFHKDNKSCWVMNDER